MWAQPLGEHDAVRVCPAIIEQFPGYLEKKRCRSVVYSIWVQEGGKKDHIYILV